MARHRTHSIEFKRQVAREFIAGGAKIASIGRTMASSFDRADARPEREWMREEALPRLVRTLPSWSGARLEGKAIDVARRDARRRS